jgi:two-component system, OmpR family, response regulator
VRVLLVDDEERMVAALRRGLAAEGFVVESAADGTAGLRLAQHGDFDAVVLDVMLPGLSGYEVVRRLRAQANWVPVLVEDLLLARADADTPTPSTTDC